MTYTCTVCNTEDTKAVKATGHQHKEVRDKVEATCTKAGYSGDTWCTDCNTKVATGSAVQAFGHDFKETGRTAATCKDTGLVTYKCSRCDETKTEVLAKTNEHVWDSGKVIVEPRCETEGTIRYTCTVCSVTKDEAVQATGHQHTVVKNQSAATCTTNGYTGDTYCTDCSKKLQSGSSIPAKGHSWNSGVVTKGATCTVAGVKTYTCTTCRGTKTESIPATGHRHTEVRNAYGASCTGRGYTGDTYCKDCGAKIGTGAWVNAIGHSYGAAYVAAQATAVSEGRMAHSCVRCGYTETWATPKLASSGNFNATNVPLKVKKNFTLKVENMAAGDWVVSWKSSNTKIATVSGGGKVYAQKKTGTVKITATLASGKVISTNVKVQKGNVNTSRVALTSPYSLTLKVKQGAQIKAVRYPVTSQQGISYSTSNKKVATVNKKGWISAKKAGSAKIYVKSGKKKATVNVKVVN